MINKNIKVLVVDDQHIERLLLITFLEKFNIKEILEADNGKSVVEICQNNPDIDLILMNIGMPIMDGYDATTEIRKFNKDVIIIAHTVYMNEEERNEILKYEFNDCMSKPFKLDQVYNIIEKYFFI